MRFLNHNLKKWINKEDVIIKKYNVLINKKEFKSQRVIDLIKKDLIPNLAKIREQATAYKTKNKDINSIKKLYIEKLDYIVKGLTKIQIGLTKGSENLLIQGRKELSNYQEEQEKFKKHLSAFLKEYNIKLIKEKK